MLRGIPLLENEKVSWLFVSWFQKMFMLSEDIWYILPNCHFMFLIGVQFISKFLEMFLWKIIVFRSSSSQIYINIVTRFQENKNETIEKTKQSKTSGVHTFQTFRKLPIFQNLRYENNIV